MASACIFIVMYLGGYFSVNPYTPSRLVTPYL
uniref:Uncharacterized protein n=1 Tax=Arundo donax TaxID=35708 RepID=A0A0A9AFV4_ARUDO